MLLIVSAVALLLLSVPSPPCKARERRWKRPAFLLAAVVKVGRSRRRREDGSSCGSERSFMGSSGGRPVSLCMCICRGGDENESRWGEGDVYVCMYEYIVVFSKREMVGGVRSRHRK